MSTTTTTTTTATEAAPQTIQLTTPMIPKPSGPNRLFTQPGRKFGDWRDELEQNGYTVVKGAIPRDRADKYADDVLTYLENFKGGLGFNRNDPSTIAESHLPIITEKGMLMGYGVAHETWAWAIRQEPGVVEAFERVYDTKDLLVSFDAMNVSFPGRKDVKPNTPWPHQDQNPEKPGFRCMQGIVNLLPNGAKDGGLIVCKGAHNSSEEFHAEFKNEENKVWSWTTEWYGFTEQGMAWLEKKGFEWVKVEAEPGDLILWDSRTPHYNLSPEGTNARIATYTCYMPVVDASQEDLVRKKKALEETKSTTHWPNALHVGGIPVLRDGVPCPYNDGKPREPVVLSERGWQLAGVPYIAAPAA